MTRLGAGHPAFARNPWTGIRSRPARGVMARITNAIFGGKLAIPINTRLDAIAFGLTALLRESLEETSNENYRKTRPLHTQYQHHGTPCRDDIDTALREVVLLWRALTGPLFIQPLALVCFVRQVRNSAEETEQHAAPPMPVNESFTRCKWSNSLKHETLMIEY
jgi:hypothetical protein